MSLRHLRESHRQDDDVEDSQDEDEEEAPPDLGETVEDLRRSIRDQAKTNQELIVEVRMLNCEKQSLEVERDLLRQELEVQQSKDSSDSSTDSVDINNVSNSTVKQDSGSVDSDGNNIRPLTPPEFEARLGVHNTTVTRQRENGAIAFREWSQSKDPDGIGWEYRSNKSKKTPKYFPINKA